MERTDPAKISFPLLEIFIGGWKQVLYGTMRNVRGYLEGGLDEAGSGRVLWLRRGGLDALVGQRNQREEGGEFRLSDEHLSDFYV